MYKTRLTGGKVQVSPPTVSKAVLYVAAFLVVISLVAVVGLLLSRSINAASPSLEKLMNYNVAGSMNDFGDALVDAGDNTYAAVSFSETEYRLEKRETDGTLVGADSVVTSEGEASVPFAFLTATGSNQGTASSGSFSVDALNGEKTLMIVAVAYRQNNDRVTSVTYNSASLTKACSTRNADYSIETYYLVNPASGSNTLAYTMNASTQDIYINASVYEGVNQADPIRTWACNNGYSTAPSVTVTSEEGDYVVASVSQYSGGNSHTNTTSGSVTQISNALGGPNVLVSQLRVPGAATSTTATWTSSANWPWAASAIAIKTDEGIGGGPEALQVELSNTTTDSDTYTSGIYNHQHTVSGFNRLMLVQVSYREYSGSPTNVDYIETTYTDGNFNTDYRNLTNLCSDRSGLYVNELWYIADPLVGDNEISVNLVDSVEDLAIIVTTYTSVNTLDPFSDYECDSYTTGNPESTIVGVENGYAYGGVATSANNTVDFGSGMVAITSSSTSELQSHAHSKLSLPSVTFDWDIQGNSSAEDLYLTSTYGDSITRHDITNGDYLDSTSLTATNFDSINSGHGFAIDPTNNTIYGVFNTDSGSNMLSTVDLANGEINQIGDLGEDFRNITFDSNGQLYGITNDYTSYPEELYAIDKSNANISFLMSLSLSSSQRSVIAYNPNDDRIYRFAGDNLDPELDRIDASVPEVASSSTPYTYDYFDTFETATYWGGASDFLVISTGYLFYSDNIGFMSYVGSIANSQGMVVYSDSTVYSVSATATIKPVESGSINVHTSGVDSDDYGPVTSIGSFSVSPSGQQRMLLILASYDTNDPSVEYVDNAYYQDEDSYINYPATNICKSDFNNYGFELWYVNDYPTNNIGGTVYAEFTGSGVDSAILSYIGLDNVDLSDPIGNFDCDGFFGNLPGATLTGSSEELVVAGITSAYDNGYNSFTPHSATYNHNTQNSGNIIGAYATVEGDPDYYWEMYDDYDLAFGAVAIKNIAANSIPAETLTGAYRIKDGKGEFKVDSQGNFIIAANNSNNPTNQDFIVTKHDSDAQHVWTYIHDWTTPPAVNSIADIEIDASDNIVLAANMDYGSVQSGEIIVLDTDGVEVDWYDFYFGPFLGSKLYSTYLDGTNLYACGSERVDNSSRYNDIYVVKYDVNGDKLWQYWFNTTPYDVEEGCRSMVLDGNDLYIVGLSASGTSSADELNRTIIRLNATTGDEVYAQTFGTEIDISSLTQDEIDRIITKDSMLKVGSELFAVIFNPATERSAISRITASTGSVAQTVDYYEFNEYIQNPFITDIVTYENHDGDTYFAVSGYNYSGGERGFIGLADASDLSYFPATEKLVGNSNPNVRVTSLLVNDNTLYASGYDSDDAQGANAYLGRFGWSVLNVTSSNEVFSKNSGLNLNDHMYMGGNEFTAEVRNGSSQVIAEVPFEFAEDDIASITIAGETDAPTYKAWYDGYSPASGSTWSLNIPRDVAHNSIRLCPDVDALVEIEEGCTGEIILPDDDPSVTNNTTHWLVSGLDEGTAYGAESFTGSVEVDITEIPFYNYNAGGADTAPVVESLNGHVITAAGTDSGSINLSKVRIFDNLTIWEESFSHPGGLLTFDIVDIDLDAAGNIYVGAKMYDNSEANYNYFLSKFDGEGRILWHKDYDGGSTVHDSFDFLQALVVDAAGNSYISGIMEVPFPTSPFWTQVSGTIKVNTNGVEQWRHIELDHGHSYTNDLTLDDSGNLYVCGGLENFDAYRRDFYVSKFNSSTGERMWVYRRQTENPGTPAVENCDAVVYGSTNNIILASGTTKAALNNGSIDRWVAGINATTGVIIWGKQETYNDVPSFAPIYTRAAVYDSVNNAFVIAGRTRFQTADSGDAFLNSYNAANGDVIFAKTVDQLTSADQFNDLVWYQDFLGDVHYVAVGTYFDSTTWRAMVRSYTATGSLEFEKLYDAGYFTAASSVAVDSRGIIYTGFLENDGTGDDVRVNKYAYLVNSLPPGLSLVVEALPGVIVDLTSAGYGGAFTATLRNGNNLPIAQFEMGLRSDVDWSTVTGDRLGLKAFAHFPGGFANTPGANDTSFSLLLPRPANADQVVICPGADDLEDIEIGCSGQVLYSLADPNVTLTTFNGQEFFKVAGLTGTGGLPINDASAVRDTMTREQVGVASDHNLEFGTTFGIDSSGDTITLDFANQFDFTAITVDDLDLIVNGVDKDLCTGPLPCSAGAGVWGVSLDDVNNVLVFTAPTDATTGEVAINDSVQVLIGLAASHQASGSNQVVNPTIVGSYEVRLEITNGATEVGELEIPIIDDDTVNITGFIDTFISFDLDTAHIDNDCDAFGGASPCNSHAATSDGAGYVVDLGELNLSTVNVSGSSTLHQDGLTGIINYIWLDLSTNAVGGAVVRVSSLNDALLGPNGSTIDSVGAGEVQITAGSGLYGLQNRFLDNKSAVSGTVVIDDDCNANGGNDFFCSVGGALGRTVFTTNNTMIDQARVQLRVGASPDGLSASGTYSDELTFIATATF